MGEIARQGLWVALGLGILLTAALKSAGPVYLALGIEASIVDVTMGYLGAASWGMVPVLGYFCAALFLRRSVVDQARHVDCKYWFAGKNTPELLVSIWWTGH